MIVFLREYDVCDVYMNYCLTAVITVILNSLEVINVNFQVCFLFKSIAMFIAPITNLLFKNLEPSQTFTVKSFRENN